MCFVLLAPLDRSELPSQATMCAFVGSSLIHKGFLCYDPKLRHVRISRNVVFLKHMSYFHSIAKLTATDFSILHAFYLQHSLDQFFTTLLQA